MAVTKIQISFFSLIILLGILNFWFLLGGYDLDDLVFTPPPEKFSVLAQQKIVNAAAKGLILNAGEKVYPVKKETTKNWLEPYFRIYSGRQELRVDSQKVRSFLNRLTPGFKKPALNARFVGGADRQEIQELSPGQAGRELDLDESTANIVAALHQGLNQAALVFKTTQPAITLGVVRQLGITTLLGRGETSFAGSPAARIQNIKTGSEIFDGLVIPPGRNFSFNETIGEIDEKNGYQAELVIKDQKLIPEYGGGVCQISTTLFRAALTAGLPILERHPHSLPVRFYNPQGYDATVYPGTSDFRFRNDTPGLILVQVIISGSSLSFEIFGAPDGRKISINGPHQYDIESDGSLKAWIKRTIAFPDGTQGDKTFYSSYKSPALFPTVRNPLE